MTVGIVLWTILFFTLIVAHDLTRTWRNRSQITTVKTATRQIIIYILIAAFFGFAIRFWTNGGSQEAYFASWITEYSLSLDNLFVFILLFKKLKIPQEKQELALFFGISVSLILRSTFLIVGVTLLRKFAFIYFVFAALLVFTAYQMKKEGVKNEWEEGKALRIIKHHNLSSFQFALFAIAITDLMFAFDSIPAVLGITDNIYVILTSNFMALMGLRQLYFLIERLINHLYYLSIGITFILLFISLKLTISALNNYGVEKIYNFKLPQISNSQSLVLIVIILGGSSLISLIRKNPE